MKFEYVLHAKMPLKSTANHCDVQVLRGSVEIIIYSHKNKSIQNIEVTF